MSLFEKDLRQTLSSEIRFDAISRRVYSVDASIYEVEPIGIVLPKNKSDLITAVKIAKKHDVPVIARGAATGITGGCLGKALIIDTSKYLNTIVEINYEKEYAICEPGVVQDRLNEALSARGYRLGPDTSTGNRATIGGMVGNNAAGARSLHYGKMVDHVISVELLLANGELITCDEKGPLAIELKCEEQSAEGHIYRAVERIRNTYRSEILERFPKIPRRVSGYNLDQLIKSPSLNLAKVIVGSEGTLGITTLVKVRICKKPAFTGLCLLHFNNMIDGMRRIPELLQYQPLSLEMIDNQIMAMGRQSPAFRGNLEWLTGTPEAIFVAEFEEKSEEDLKKRIAHFEKEMIEKKVCEKPFVLLDKTAMEQVWALRKSGLGLLLSRRTYSRAIAFVEDVTVAPENLANFMHEFRECLNKHGKGAGIYGHIGSGCMHVRPFIDLRQPHELQEMSTILEEVSDLLLKYCGALSGEHGDGLIRSWLNKKMFGDTLYKAFEELKYAFDPDNRMNPNKIVNGKPLLENLRLNPDLKRNTIETFLDFSAEGGFELAVDLCNGNGMCRKSENVMCPSFQATGDEYDTTRARAQALRAVVNGRVSVKNFTSKGVYDVLDLCLECKGCKTECPSQVDMAKMKSEFLYHYGKAHGFSLRSKIFGGIGSFNKMFSGYPAFFNAMQNSRVSRKILEWIGIAPQRKLPELAAQKFSEWFKQQKFESKKERVVLFNDTYNEFNEPHIGKAAVKIFQALGIEPIVLPWQCCGRPLISKGFLAEAKAGARTLFQNLKEYAEQGIPIIGLEPSCILTLKDDYASLLGIKGEEIEQFKKSCLTLEEFLLGKLKNGDLKLNNKCRDLPLHFHGHCHQKAVIGMKPMRELFRLIPQYESREIDSGCCGMAGSFGYEKEHYAISMQIGELKLFPAVRKANEDAVIVANGISCRSQIKQGTGKRAVHIAEAIADCL